ncbi:hypothetical protein, conserved [Thermococcus kodakarensis KOD1]|uniref:Lipoprotein n=1 Tax=Thermococcus kodakarensis (strain ATCC BAA-918 / JCM 12380 / KOD1) TaxID=69014 RepID=Q5JH00_THEKO|nr:hypothetical protein [Thermococcus kodakarensis]WCN27366.1 hypothetical protein POG15_07060 [Thermococcus kodakarensis]WCN29655.1 hypothetical protein POG21_07055 [Thermococcus kodakarensis]BAD85579.1 hypothetical protein, conserved [Thermococcus kodakarensis KOD1]
MRKILTTFLLAIIVVMSGCIGENAGLTKEKVLTAIQNIETARYNESFSMSMNIFDPNTNKTVNVTMSGSIAGVFNKSAGIEAGNMNLTTRMMGMDINMNWPYFTNGSDVYFNIDGKWYFVPSNNDLHNRARASLNVDYIEKLLREKNVTFKKLGDVYAFRVNVTFWEFVNATNQTTYLNEAWGPLSDNITVNTNAGWVEVHFRDDGTPTFIETYIDLTIIIPDEFLQEPVTIHETIHDSTVFSDINKPTNITIPEGIESAGDFEEVFG